MQYDTLGIKGWERFNLMRNVVKKTSIDALPTPWRTQMWVQVKDNGKGRSRGMLPNSQHFEG
jgi:hypothetical protein